MAATQEGRVLTDRHRRAQVRKAIAARSSIRRTMTLLDPANIDGTRLVWEREMSQVLGAHYRMSANEASEYLRQFRLAEIGSSGGSIIVPEFDTAATIRTLDANGPQLFKKQIRAGQSESAAWLRISKQIQAEAQKLILAGGRDLLRETGKNDRRAVGYRRVTDGDPCTFCAMLCSRGPAYTSEAKALSKHGSDNPYHNHCGCSVEVIYHDWEPTEVEQGYIDAYYAAAEAAKKAGQPRTAETVLYRMREAGDFKDSPARRALDAAT